MNYVIIGNSIAGTNAVKGIREIDKENKIIMLSDELEQNYSRPLISYLLARKVSRERINYVPNDFYQKNKVELLLNKKAESINIREKFVYLNDGEKIKFDKLLLAVGGKPIIPEIKGINCNGIFSFTKLSDIEQIEKYLKENKVKNVVILGAGLIGLKATEAILELKLKVTIIELSDRILAATLDKKASEIFENELRKNGCEIIIQNTIKEIISEKEKIKGVVLNDGNKINADMLIIAIGVRPNIELVKNTEIKTNRGIIINSRMETNIKDIYAAGDCVEPTIAIWPIAAKQGKIAGNNMAGLAKEFNYSLPMNSVELCNIPSISVGITNPQNNDCEILSIYNEEKKYYKKIVLKENKIIGFIMVGNISRAGIYTMLINDKIDISEFKESLLKENFGLINLPKDFRKHLVKGAGIEV